MKKISWIVFLLSVLVGCSSGPRNADETEQLTRDELAQKTFDKGLRALEKREYAEAAKIFDKMLVNQPATEFDVIVLYNSGSAYEGLGRCEEAVTRFRKAVDSSRRKFKRVESQSLYKLSLMYECLNQDTKTIASLLEARKRGTVLTYEIRHAEIPARLASAYARIGNRKKALEYFTVASKALKTIVAKQDGHKQSETLGRTLYFMGQLSPSQREARVPTNTYLQGLSIQQPHLLQAIELGHPVWSKRALADLSLAYDNLWRFEFKGENERRAFFTRGLQNINELRKLQLPNGGPESKTLFEELSKVERKIQTELTKVDVSPELTPDAKKREGLKREGRIGR